MMNEPAQRKEAQQAADLTPQITGVMAAGEEQQLQVGPRASGTPSSEPSSSPSSFT